MSDVTNPELESTPILGIKYCPQCGSRLSDEHYHTVAQCNLTHFLNDNIPGKCGLADITVDVKIQGDWVASELAKAWPRVVSKIFIDDAQVIAAFTEAWAVAAIKTFLQAGGYADMTLSDFLAKVANDRTNSQ